MSPNVSPQFSLEPQACISTVQYLISLSYCNKETSILSSLLTYLNRNLGYLGKKARITNFSQQTLRGSGVQGLRTLPSLTHTNPYPNPDASRSCPANPKSRPQSIGSSELRAPRPRTHTKLANQREAQTTVTTVHHQQKSSIIFTSRFTIQPKSPPLPFKLNAN